MSLTADARQLFTRRPDVYARFIRAVRYPQGLRAFWRASPLLHPGLRLLEAGCGTGALTFALWDAAKERGILAIGNVIDTQADYPDTVVVSALWQFEPTLDHAIGAVKAGSFKAEDYGQYSFMKAGGCSLSPLGTFEGKVPADVMAKVKEREGAIKSGAFTAPVDDSEPKSS